MIFKDQIVEIRGLTLRAAFVQRDGYLLRARMTLATSLTDEQVAELGERFPASLGKALLSSFEARADLASAAEIKVNSALPPLLYSFEARSGDLGCEVEEIEGAPVGAQKIAPAKDGDALELTWKIEADLDPDTWADIACCSAVPLDKSARTIARLTTSLVPDKQRSLFDSARIVATRNVLGVVK